MTLKADKQTILNKHVQPPTDIPFKYFLKNIFREKIHIALEYCNDYYVIFRNILYELFLGTQTFCFVLLLTIEQSVSCLKIFSYEN